VSKDRILIPTTKKHPPYPTKERTMMLTKLCALTIGLLSTSTLAFAPSTPQRINKTKQNMSATPMAVPIEPSKRDAEYGRNIAKYLVDLHDAKATFDFCGGMMFQLVLTDKLRSYLENVARESDADEQPVVFDAAKSRMFNIPEYSKNGLVDNVRLFHGREVRKVPNAAGGMNFVLQLSLASSDGKNDPTTNDPQGWTTQEVEGYDGWGHDVGRVWRTGERLEQEGVVDFRKTFGQDSFTLCHRFYLHLDGRNRLWLSAEDGCEGTPSEGKSFLGDLSNMFGL